MSYSTLPNKEPRGWSKARQRQRFIRVIAKARAPPSSRLMRDGHVFSILCRMLPPRYRPLVSASASIDTAPGRRTPALPKCLCLLAIVFAKGAAPRKHTLRGFTFDGLRGKLRRNAFEAMPLADILARIPDSEDAPVLAVPWVVGKRADSHVLKRPVTQQILRLTQRGVTDTGGTPRA